MKTNNQILLFYKDIIHLPAQLLRTKLKFCDSITYKTAQQNYSIVNSTDPIFSISPRK